jgi:hypothetical protein
MLMTRQTERWSEQEITNAQNAESRMIFSNFSPLDNGISRIYVGGCETKANAARIVACVNACAGMDDPAVEIERLRAERTELLEALQMATAVMTACDAPKVSQKTVREVIAKMKGTNP